MRVPRGRTERLPPETSECIHGNDSHPGRTGEKSVGETRQAHAESMDVAELGVPPGTTQELTFEVAERDERDPDETIAVDA